MILFTSSRTMNMGGDLLEKPTTEVEESGSYWPGNPALPPPPAPRNTFLNSRVRSLMSLSLSNSIQPPTSSSLSSEKRNYLNRGDVAAVFLPLQNLLVLDRQGLGKGKRYNIFSLHSNFKHKHCWGLFWMVPMEFEKSSCILLPWNFKNEDKSSGACSCRVISLRRMVQHRGWERLILE